jgi:hypothetical protein
MDEKEAMEKIRSAVQAEIAERNPTKIVVKSRVKNFLDGSLFFVYFYLEKDTRDHLYYVYLRGDDITIIKSIPQLADIMSIYRPEPIGQKFIGHFFSVPGMASIIAVLVLLTIFYLMAYKGVEKPPDILAAAFTTILGFYFGSLASKK